MRFADILRLSLSALWQQKLRTLLTLAGIAICAFVLAVNLSIGQGVREEVYRQLRHGDQLRQILVFANKRSRPPVLLTDATLAKLRALPHVESVAPIVNEWCDLCLSRDLLRPEQVATAAGLAAAPQGQRPLLVMPPLLPLDQAAVTFIARPNDDYVRDRIIAGRFLSSADANEVVVTKRMLDKLAMGRGEPVESFIGQKLNVVFPSSRRNKVEMNKLLGVLEQALEPVESQVVRKVLVRLWEAGNHSPLTAHEQAAIERVLQRDLDNPATSVQGKETATHGKDTAGTGKGEIVPGKGTLLTGKDTDERAALAKIRLEFETVRKDLNLTAADRDALESVMRRYLGEPQKSLPGQLPFREDLLIVGVLRDYADADENLGLNLAAQLANMDVFLPPVTAERLFRHSPKWNEFGHYAVFVSVDEEENMKEVVIAIKNMGLVDRSLVQLADEVVLSMTIHKFLTSFLSLMVGLAGALGIINIMYMCVLERTHEIGVMKAVGARDRHIQMIFLVEGGLLGVLGGGFGVLASWLASYPGDAYARYLLEQIGLEKHIVVRHLRHSLFVYPWWVVLGVPLLACAVTTLAAVLPARRAAKVNPIQALRHE